MYSVHALALALLSFPSYLLFFSMAFMDISFLPIVGSSIACLRIKKTYGREGKAG